MRFLGVAAVVTIVFGCPYWTTASASAQPSVFGHQPLRRGLLPRAADVRGRPRLGVRHAGQARAARPATEADLP
jgi:hypothetical protein